MASDNIATTKKSIALIEEKVKEAKKQLTAKDAAELETKYNKFKVELVKMAAMYEHINEANKKVADLVTTGKTLPPALATNLSELQNTLRETRESEQKAAEFASHKATGYTICDYLNGLKECLAAFSTITNVASKSIKAIVINIGIDKAIPFATNKATPLENGASKTTSQTFVHGQSAKLFALVLTDLQGLTSPLGLISLAGDIISFIVDILLETYCGTYTGTVTQTYKFRNFNDEGEDWWIYTGKLEGKITLRYPKATSTGNVIKMKGYIEGNGTKFTFGADPKKAIRDVVPKEVYDHTKLVPIKEMRPITVPFSTAIKDEVGFGFGARMLATPACFLILVDAEYNQEKKEIKLFINEATIDFTPAVKFRQMYAFIKYNIVPELNYQDYPVAKVFKTFKKNFEDKNYFAVTALSKSTTFKGNVTKKVNVKGQEIDLSIDIDAKKE